MIRLIYTKIIFAKNKQIFAQMISYGQATTDIFWHFYDHILANCPKNRPSDSPGSYNFFINTCKLKDSFSKVGITTAAKFGSSVHPNAT